MRWKAPILENIFNAKNIAKRCEKILDAFEVKSHYQNRWKSEISRRRIGLEIDNFSPFHFYYIRLRLARPMHLNYFMKHLSLKLSMENINGKTKN